MKTNNGRNGSRKGKIISVIRDETQLYWFFCGANHLNVSFQKLGISFVSKKEFLKKTWSMKYLMKIIE